MTALPEDEAFLAHYGVKGMRWGKRKGGDSASPATPTTPRTRREETIDVATYGTKGSARIGQRMEAGRSKGSARRREFGVQSAQAAGTIAAIAGTAYVALVGPHIMQAGLNQAVRSGRAANGAKAAARLFSDTNGIANHKTVNMVFDAVTKTWN